jgi:PIN domain nuclease of toxin-antitoxin system
MRLLLDTHTALWWLDDDERIGREAERLLLDTSNEVLLSAVVIWEVTVKRALGKLEAPVDIADRFLDGGATALPITLQHAAAVGELPDHHRDPFDRLLVAQARVDGATVLTGDAQIARYSVPTAW